MFLHEYNTESKILHLLSISIVTGDNNVLKNVYSKGLLLTYFFPALVRQISYLILNLRAYDVPSRYPMPNDVTQKLCVCAQTIRA